MLQGTAGATLSQHGAREAKTLATWGGAQKDWAQQAQHLARQTGRPEQDLAMSRGALLRASASRNPFVV